MASEAEGAHRSNRYDDAMLLYTDAISAYGFDAAAGRRPADDRLYLLHSNRAACRLKLHASRVGTPVVWARRWLWDAPREAAVTALALACPVVHVAQPCFLRPVGALDTQAAAIKLVATAHVSLMSP